MLQKHQPTSLDLPKTGEVELRTIWHLLRERRFEIIEASTTALAHTLTLRACAPQRALPIKEKDLVVFEAALASGIRRLVAEGVGLSCSTVAVITQSTLQRLGLDCLPSRLPALLVFVVRAARDQSSAKGFLENAGDHYVVGTSRPEFALNKLLGPAELEVLKLLVEGLSYADIAVRRAASVRTVANQVASAFRRLGVSGRAELLTRLFTLGFGDAATTVLSNEPLQPSPGRRTANSSSLQDVLRALEAVHLALGAFRAANSEQARSVVERISFVEETISGIQNELRDRGAV